MSTSGTTIEATLGDAAASPSLRQRKKDATRTALSDAAWDLFAERGYDATSINDIAERADVAPRTFFRYFPTKESVMYPEWDDMVTRVRSAFLERPADEPVMFALITALEQLAASMTEDSSRNHQRFMIMKQTDPETVGTYLMERLDEQVVEMVRDRDRDHPDVDLRAKLASGLIRLIMETSRAHWIETGAAEALPDVGTRCMSCLSDLLHTVPEA